MRPREAEISVSLLRGPSTIENEPASGWSGWWSRPRDMSVAIWARDNEAFLASRDGLPGFQSA